VELGAVRSAQLDAAAPEVEPPVIRLHDRVVLRLVLKALLFAAVGWAIMWVLIDLFEKIDSFVDHQATTLAIVRFYLYQLPDIVRQTLPVDVLLASMFSLSVLAKNNELVALLASGVSLLRIARPIFVIGILACALSVLLSEKVVPETNRRMQQVRRVEIEKRPPVDAPVRYAVSYRGEGGYLYHIDVLNTEDKTLKGVTVHRYRDGRVVARLLAKSAVWRGDHWEFHDGFYRTFAPPRADADSSGSTGSSSPSAADSAASAGGSAQGAADSMARGSAGSLMPVATPEPQPGPTEEHAREFHTFRLYDLTETPTDLARLEPEPDEMTYEELRRYVDRVSQSGGNVNDYLVRMNAKLADPFTSLVLAVLGVGLTARKKKASLVAGFGQTLVIGFGYLMLSQIGAALGKNEQLPPFFAAWVGNFIFGTAAVYFLARANR
jgi:lipopolysaccharide export system permease protein